MVIAFGIFKEIQILSQPIGFILWKCLNITVSLTVFDVKEPLSSTMMGEIKETADESIKIIIIAWSSPKRPPPALLNLFIIGSFEISFKGIAIREIAILQRINKIIKAHYLQLQVVSFLIFI